MHPILLLFRSSLIQEDICPECLGELDTGGECNSCSYDTAPDWGEYQRYLEMRNLLEEIDEYR